MTIGEADRVAGIGLARLFLSQGGTPAATGKRAVKKKWRSVGVVGVCYPLGEQRRGPGVLQCIVLSRASVRALA